MMKIDYTTMWTMSDAMKRSSLIVKDEHPLNNADTLRFIQGRIHLSEPVVYKYHMGETPNDLVGTTWVGRYLLADRLIDVLRQHKLTGWSTYDVRILGENGGEISGYQGLLITGCCGAPDHSRSEVVKPRSAGFIKMRGLYFDEKTWDGSDFFMPDSTAYICMTNTAREAILELNPTNIEFKRLDEIVAPVWTN
jgi:hypothetical protein